MFVAIKQKLEGGKFRMKNNMVYTTSIEERVDDLSDGVGNHQVLFGLMTGIAERGIKENVSVE